MPAGNRWIAGLLDCWIAGSGRIGVGQACRSESSSLTSNPAFQQSSISAIHNRETVFTPYDWQEGIGNRAQYIEGKLAQGLPVLALSLAEGILLFTYRRQARKIYEIYDRLIFAGVGQQSDVEALRIAAVD